MNRPNTFIPLAAQALLRKAAATSTEEDQLARVKAIEAAEKKIRLEYPYLFREDESWEE